MTRSKWIDADVEKPGNKRSYDMCLLDIGEKSIPGWWTGTGWDGLNYRNQAVKRWKFITSEQLLMGFT